MCGPGQPSDDSTPSDVKVESNLNSSDESESNEATKSTDKHHQRQTKNSPKKEMNKKYDDVMISDETSLSWSVLSGVFHGTLWCVLSFYLPFFIWSLETTRKFYSMASFNYDPKRSLFDNTIWTYGTDYALATITGAFAVWILRTSSRSSRQEVKRLARISATMLILYSMSTGAGAIAHHFFLTVESRNSLAFRLLWTVCVSTVYLAAAPMGMIGSECLQIFQPRSNCSRVLKTMPYLRNIYWFMYGATGAFGFAKGFLSFQRPACDIFIAGVTQTPCTFYFMAFLFLVEHPGITKFMKIYGNVGFILNAHMFFIYPFIVDHLGWSMAATNTYLHANLCISWSLQGLILQRIVKSLVEEETKDEKCQKELREKKVQ